MITTLKLRGLSSDAFFGFYTDVVKSIQRYGTEALAPYTAPIEAMYPKLEAGYKLGRMNEITAEIKALDEQRDRSLNGLKKILEGYESSHKPDDAETATRLLYSLNKYGNITRLTYSEQSGALTSLLKEWEVGTLKDNLQLLNLLEWVEHLRLVQEKFATRYLDRTEDESMKKAIPISKLTPEALALYQNFVLMLTAFARMNSTEYEPFANFLDELVKKYNEAIRSGGSSKKEMKE